MCVIFCVNFWSQDKEKIGSVLYRNIKARSCYHCCRGKGIRITYPECVFVCIRSYQHANAPAP